MTWTYKDITITINTDGQFYFTVHEQIYKVSTLQLAKNTIDDLLKSYYTFSKEDYDKLLSKLSPREQHFIKNLVDAFSEHLGDSYCELGYNLQDFNATFIE